MKKPGLDMIEESILGYLSVWGACSVVFFPRPHNLDMRRYVVQKRVPEF